MPDCSGIGLTSNRANACAKELVTDLRSGAVTGTPAGLGLNSHLVARADLAIMGINHPRTHGMSMVGGRLHSIRLPNGKQLRIGGVGTKKSDST